MMKDSKTKLYCSLIYTVIVLTLTSVCDAKGIYIGYWSTYIPSEYGYDFFLKDDGSCKLFYHDSPGNEMSIEWETNNCKWVSDNNSLIISISNDKVKKNIKQNIYSGNIVSEEVTSEHFDLKGLTIKYTIDKNYINKYLEKLYKTNYKINNITAIVPERNSSCIEELCELPFFKADNGIHKSMSELIKEGVNSKRHMKPKMKGINEKNDLPNEKR